MKINKDFIAPCGLYCGVCGIYIADKSNNRKFQERFLSVYQGKIAGKGKMPNSENLTVEDIQCNGCLSNKQFLHCRKCEIKNCVLEKGYKGCHQCDEFPCKYIENFPMTLGKKVILRAIPYWRQVGTQKWIQDEEARYICPKCGNKVFRGAVRCNKCKTDLDLD